MNSTEFLTADRYTAVGIKSIKPVKTEKTFDFEVQDDHSFLLENNVISSNSVELAPSISLRVTKGKIKATDLAELEYMYKDGIPKHLTALGIVSRIELYKSRFTRPFRKVQLMIPYDFGLPEFAGMFDYLSDNGIIVASSRKGYYNGHPSEITFEKDFSRKQFIKDGYAKKILDHLLEREKAGHMFDFIMKAQEDIDRENQDDDSEVDEENVESVEA